MQNLTRGSWRTPELLRPDMRCIRMSCIKTCCVPPPPLVEY